MNEQYESDKRTAILSGMTEEAATSYADRLQQHPSRGQGRVLAALDRAKHTEALDEWAASKELGAWHVQCRRNMSTAERLFNVVLTARDSLDCESGWFSSADEARAAIVAALNDRAPYDLLDEKTLSRSPKPQPGQEGCQGEEGETE